MDVFEYFGSFCANCKLFGWEQPDPRASPLKRCTGCWKIYYCSQECQEEHWRKLHKRHCKFFSGKMGLEGTVVHNKDTCGRCAKRKAAGKRVYKDDDPTYICFFDPLNPKATRIQQLQMKYPLPSEDSPRSRNERIIDILLILLLKIKLTKQPVSQLYSREVEIIEEELLGLKAQYYVDSIVFPKSCHAGPRNSKNLAFLVNKTFLVNKMSYLPVEGTLFQMWRTFVVLFGLGSHASSIETDLMIKKPEVSLPKDMRKLSKLMRGGSLHRAIDKILEVLEQEVVSVKDLKANGNLRDTWIELIFWTEPAQLLWNNAVTATAVKLLPTRCDFCFLLAPVTEVHR